MCLHVQRTPPALALESASDGDVLVQFDRPLRSARDPSLRSGLRCRCIDVVGGHVYKYINLRGTEQRSPEVTHAHEHINHRKRAGLRAAFREYDDRVVRGSSRFFASLRMTASG